MIDKSVQNPAQFDKTSAVLLSIVVPLFNEQASLFTLITEINGVVASTLRLREQGLVELIFVDDGSTDGSWQTIQSLAADRSWIKALRFHQRSGKSVALRAGFDKARGDYIVMLDADLQDNPAEIPRVIEKLDQGHDLVCGWKKCRKDPLGKVVSSRLFNFVVSEASGLRLHDHNCGLKGYRKATVQALPLYGGLHRFITIYAHSCGFSVCEIEIGHRPRRYGHSKYGVSRFFRAAIDFMMIILLTVDGRQRARSFGRVGVGLLLSAIVMTLFCFFGPPAMSATSFTHILKWCALAAGFFGALLLAISNLAEMANRNYQESRRRGPIIAEAIGFESSLKPSPISS
jgi:glycosyltransferase involved in cell wall biosynthesis